MSIEAELAARGVSLTAKLIAGVVALVLLGVVVWAVFFRPAAEHQAAVQSGVEVKAAGAAVETGKDAAATGERVQVVHDRIERITRENTTRILAAPGASDAIPPAVDAALVAALCMRDARLDDPACVGMHQPAAGVGDWADTKNTDPAS